MPELGPYGSVRGARGNSRPYRESGRRALKTALLTLRGRGAMQIADRRTRNLAPPTPPDSHAEMWYASTWI
jgi:hypothetical protein